MGLEDLERRVEELESQHAFQDELHQQLNEIVTRQDREILQLKQQIKTLAERLQDLRDASSADASSPADEVPPHY